jgi:pimeloyl-ACP methyl ester carboxylesterase
VTWGRKDPVIPLRVGRQVAATIPGARLVEYDAGHVPFSTHPADFLGEVLPFLAAAHDDALTRGE